MNILIVNDDGYQSKGLEILAKALNPFANVYVSAPKDHQSAKSHAITIKHKVETFMATPIQGSIETLVVDGTPADCTRLGLKLFNVDFDLVVSGINYGPNIAKDVIYSGTVAAAIEAKIANIPAIAISAPTVHLPYLYDECIKLFDELIESKIYEEIPGILNINFPKDTYQKPLGVKLTKQGLRYHHAEYIKSEKEGIYHVNYSLMNYLEDPMSDVKAYDEGYISITPLTLDRTCHQSLKKLNELE